MLGTMAVILHPKTPLVSTGYGQCTADVDFCKWPPCLLPCFQGQSQWNKLLTFPPWVTFCRSLIHLGKIQGVLFTNLSAKSRGMRVTVQLGRPWSYLPSLMYSCFEPPKFLSSFGATLFFWLFLGVWSLAKQGFCYPRLLQSWGFLSLDYLPGLFNTRKNS